MKDSKAVKKVDFVLLAAIVSLVGFGLMVLYGLGARTSNASFNMQLIWFMIGLVAMGIISVVSFQQLKHYAAPVYVIGIILLLVVMLTGHSAKGASRWIGIGFIKIQPSEFAKIVVIMALAAFLSERKGILRSNDLALSALIVMVPALLVFRQPDLGTALVIMVIWLGAIIVSGVKPLHILAVFLIGIAIVFLALKFDILHQYQLNRLLVFINPNLDVKGDGWNLLQSKIAIGSGGVFGKGLFSGSQTNLSFVPESHTDFIFAVIGEKLGFLGAITLIFLYFVLLSRAVYIALTADNYYGSLIALSIGTMWLFQIFVNIGMTIGIMPIAGIPLPFISYGGSALLTNMAACGILLNIYSRSIK